MFQLAGAYMVVATYLSGNTDFATGAARKEDLTLTKFNVARTPLALPQRPTATAQ